MVANSFNKIVEESNKKVPRKKRNSDKIYNARRRAKRKLERELKKIESNQNVISTLREKIEESYFNKKSKKYNYDTNAFVLDSIYFLKKEEKKGSDSLERKNELFKRDINQASIGGVSPLTKEEVKVFYAATQKFWQGKPQGTWNQAIMQKLGTNSLEKAWNKVFSMERVQEALEEANANQKPAKSDAEVSNGKNEERDEKGSPPFIKELVLDIDTYVIYG